MDLNTVRSMMAAACDCLVSCEQELCRLDSFIGDGDHGVTVARGFRAAKEGMGRGCSSLRELFEGLGNSLAGSMGGAIGPVFGSVFSEGASALEGKTVLDAAGLAALFSGGLEAVTFIGGAKEGDRTLVDALAPAVRALQECAARGLNVAEALQMAAEAARAGMESTKNMVARFGRAKFLGEKSRGYIDAGAASFTLLLESMAQFAAKSY